MKIGKTLARSVPLVLCALVLAGALVVALAGCGVQSAGEQQTSARSASAVLTGKSQAKPSARGEDDISAAAASSNAFAFDLFGASRPEGRELRVLALRRLGGAFDGDGRGQGSNASRSSPRCFTWIFLRKVSSRRWGPLTCHLPVSRISPPPLRSGARPDSPMSRVSSTSSERHTVLLFGWSISANYGAAAKIINQWVTNATNGRIQRRSIPRGPRPDIIVLMLTNAVYMKAKWKKPFLLSHDQRFSLPSVGRHHCSGADHEPGPRRSQLHGRLDSAGSRAPLCGWAAFFPRHPSRRRTVSRKSAKS